MTVYRYAFLALVTILCGLAAWYVFQVVIFGMLVQALNG